MPFSKDRVVVFKERSGTGRRVRGRGWIGLVLCLVICLMAAGNVWLWDYYLKSRTLEGRLVEAERALDERDAQMISVVADLEALRGDLERVQQFDAKLRVLMDMDGGVSDGTALGGSSSEDMTLGYLPLYRQELAARKIRSFLRELSDEVRLEEVEQQGLLVTMRENRDKLAVMPSIWPTEGFVTSSFGTRNSPFTGRAQSHKGLDIAANIGTPIYAPARGVVTAAGQDGAYGICVDIDHGGGITTKYAHMQKFVVKVGQVVERGEIIGHVGRTGRTTGPHLHYEVRLNGVPTNPYAYILN